MLVKITNGSLSGSCLLEQFHKFNDVKIGKLNSYTFNLLLDQNSNLEESTTSYLRITITPENVSEWGIYE